MRRNGSTLSQSKKSGIAEGEAEKVASAYELNVSAPATEPSERAHHAKNRSVDHISQGCKSGLGIPSLLQPAQFGEGSLMKGPGIINHSARNTE